MPKFRVYVTEIESGFATVEARNEHHAEEKAEEQLADGSIDYRARETKRAVICVEEMDDEEDL